MEKTKKAWINGLFLTVTLVINTLGAFDFINGLSQKFAMLHSHYQLHGLFWNLSIFKRTGRI